MSGTNRAHLAVILVCYDIADSKRLRRVFDICKSYGDHVQFSVFRMRLSRASRVRLLAELEDAIHHTEDRVLLIEIGPDTPSTRKRFQCLGTQEAYANPEVTII